MSIIHNEQVNIYIHLNGTVQTFYLTNSVIIQMCTMNLWSMNPNTVTGMNN